MPQHLVDFLGPKPDSVRGARRWRQLAADVTEYRQRYDVADPVRALGADPNLGELGQQQAWRKLRLGAERLRVQQREHGAARGEPVQAGERVGPVKHSDERELAG
jgi:hypothetical protein